MGGSGEDEARRARQAEVEREGRVKTGTESIRKAFASAFGDKYYAGLEKDALKSLQTPVDLSFNESMRNLQAALMRGGMYDSSAAARKIGLAEQEKGIADLGVKQRARGIVSQRKQDVANAEGQVLGQLQASANPASAVQQAGLQIAANSAYGDYQPMGQVFTDFTAGLATQADLERQGNAAYNTGWFPPRGRTSSSRYATTVG